MENRFVLFALDECGGDSPVVSSHSLLKDAVKAACVSLNTIVHGFKHVTAEQLFEEDGNRVYILDLETNKVIVRLIWFSNDALVLAGGPWHWSHDWEAIPHIWREELLDVSPIFWSFKEFDGTGEGAMPEPMEIGTLVELDGAVYQNVSDSEESVWRSVKDNDDWMHWATLVSKGEPKIIFTPEVESDA